MAVGIHLHVGVHKTATTFIQNWLEASREALSTEGIGYMPLMPLRRAFTSQLGRLDDGQAWLKANVGDFFVGDLPDREAMRLVISDENLVGQCGMLLNSGVAFENAGERLRHVRSLFSESEITLWCSVRSYEGFLTSAYCEGIRNNRRFIPFWDFIERLDLEMMRWPSVIARFEQGLRPQKTCVWRYEDFSGNAGRIVQGLAFGTELSEEARPREDSSRPSLSHATVDLLEYAAEAFGTAAASRIIEGLASNLPKSAGYPAYAPWRRVDRIQLDSWYQQDCEELKARGWFMEF